MTFISVGHDAQPRENLPVPTGWPEDRKNPKTGPDRGPVEWGVGMAEWAGGRSQPGQPDRRAVVMVSVFSLVLRLCGDGRWELTRIKVEMKLSWAPEEEPSSGVQVPRRPGGLAGRKEPQVCLTV